MQKLVIRYILAVLAVILIWLGIRYLNAGGRIIVTTNSSSNSISLFKIAEDEQKAVGNAAPKQLSEGVRPGTYLIKVNSVSFATSKIVTIKARQTLRYAINPVGLTALEPVSPSSASSIVADSSSLLYIEAGNNTLNRIDAQNNTQVLDGTQQLLSVQWADTSFGIGKDPNGRLYSVTGGSITPLAVPFNTNDDKPIYFVVSADRQIFVTHGSDVYTGTIAGTFKKIYTAKSPVPSLASIGDKVAVLEAPGDTTNKDIPPAATIVDTSGKVLAQKPVESNFGDWSNDGKYLMITDDDAGGEIVNGSLGTVATLPPVTISSSIWVGDTLYYTTANELWSYSIATQTSQLVASMPDSALSDAALSGDGSYIYLTVTANDDNTNSQIYRLGLRGQKVADDVYQLPIILPDNTQPCSLSFVNFTYPTVVGYANSNPAQTCAAAVQTVFAPYGIDTSLLHDQFNLVSTAD